MIPDPHDARGFRIRIERSIAMNAITLHLMTDEAVVSSLKFDRRELGVAYPGFSVNGTAAQLLMDDLWSIGVRPTEGAGSAGAMAAVQAHLADMRRLVFRE